MSELTISRVPNDEMQHDDRFLPLIRLCWGYVPLETSCVFSIESGDDLIATADFGLLKSDPETALLFGDSVHPEYRRQGLHSRLIADRIAYAREVGCRRCVATTYGPHTASARNYERAGFRQESWIPDGPAEHQTEWVLDLTDR